MPFTMYAYIYALIYGLIFKLTALQLNDLLGLVVTLVATMKVSNNE